MKTYSITLQILCVSPKTNRCSLILIPRSVTARVCTLCWICARFHVTLLLIQAANGGRAGGWAAAGQSDPHAAAAGGLPEDDQPTRDPRPAVPTEQLSICPAEPAAMEREYRKDKQRNCLRVESAQTIQQGVRETA